MKNINVKKRIVFINAVPYGSTGKIVKDLAEMAESYNCETMRFYSWTKSYRKSVAPNIFIGSFWGKLLHMLLAKMSGYLGCFSVTDTYRMIRRMEEFKPDIIHLNILHCWNVNLPILFRYIKKNKIRVIWTMHDCWAITGQCPHFVMVGCDKWKKGCQKCPQIHQYPSSLIDQTKKMWKLKKKWFTGIDDMTIVAPSKWLAELMQHSYLSNYPVCVINNGLDLSIFSQRLSNFREKYNLKEKYIILGVAFDWGIRKGLDIFVRLSECLDDRYKIVLVGTDDVINKKLPDNIITIERTKNQEELAEIYSAADVFANPTREEVLGMVNLEALACGTPVVSFDTGGSPECLNDECGIVVPCDDFDAFKNAIVDVCKTQRISSDACIRQARKFDKNLKYMSYVNLYNR